MKIPVILSLLLILASCNMKTIDECMIEAQELDEKGKYKEAIVIMNEVLERDDEFVPAYLNRGAYKSALGDEKGAVMDYKQAIKLEPDKTLAIVNLGNAYNRQEKYTKAIYYYNKAFESKGGEHQFEIVFEQDRGDYVSNSEIYYRRGISYLNIDSLKQAHSDLTIAMSDIQYTTECYYFMGVLYLKAGRDEIACSYLRKAENFGDNDASVLIDEYCNGR